MCVGDDAYIVPGDRRSMEGRRADALIRPYERS